MICFQISIFAKGNTADIPSQSHSSPLWFAFKLVSLQKEIQRRESYQGSERVVICFQISIFAKGNTAEFGYCVASNLLWFAFKLVSLQKEIQPALLGGVDVNSCDLLSN